MTNKSHNVTNEFLLELVPKHLVETAQLLGSLDYPIPDKKSLHIQLEKLQIADQQGKKAIDNLSQSLLELTENVEDTFEPEDFGIDTPRSALEKFFARSHRNPASPYSPIPSIPRLPAYPWWDLPPEPSPSIPVDPEFGSDLCGTAARKLWDEHLASPVVMRMGFGFPAYYHLLVEGSRRCRRTTFPSPDDSIDSNCREQWRRSYAECLVSMSRGCEIITNRNIQFISDTVGCDGR